METLPFRTLYNLFTAFFIPSDLVYSKIQYSQLWRPLSELIQTWFLEENSSNLYSMFLMSQRAAAQGWNNNPQCGTKINV